MTHRERVQNLFIEYEVLISEDDKQVAKKESSNQKGPIKIMHEEKKPGKFRQTATEECDRTLTPDRSPLAARYPER